MKVYCDGSAKPTNPGPGGLAIVVCDNQDNVLYTIGHRSKWSTNNRMEMLAVLGALQLFGKQEEVVIVYSDSAYTVNTFTLWSYTWKNKGWIKSDNKEPENLDIIKEYHSLLNQGYRIHLEKVKGHASSNGNILADEIARGDKKADYEL